MILLLLTALLSLPESTGIPALLLSGLHLPSAGTEVINQQNIKIALQVLGILMGLPESIKQSITQSMGIQALQYSWWWNKSGKAQWVKLKPKLDRFNAWRKGLPATKVTIAWNSSPATRLTTKPLQP
jgi:hypothetical protein